MQCWPSRRLNGSTESCPVILSADPCIIYVGEVEVRDGMLDINIQPLVLT